MKTTTLMLLLGCMLVLAGVLSGARPVLGQMDGVCPRPPGVDTLDPPSPKAQEVTNDSTLTQFAGAVRTEYNETSAATVEEASYFGCVLRQNDGDWHEGSTYIVTVALSGRVSFHAKDMSLGGRKLQPLVLQAIVQAIGLTQVGTIGNEEGGLFDWDGGGNDGYAAVYDGTFGKTILLAGFDLDGVSCELLNTSIPPRQ